MRTSHGSIHLEIQTSRKSPVGVLRTSFRDDGKIKHQQLGRIVGCSLNQLKLLQLAFQEKVVPQESPEAFTILESKEYGASYTLKQFIKNLELDTVIYSRNEPWVNDVLAMIIGKLIFAGSKLSLCNRFDTSSLWELFGVQTRPDVDTHCYAALDRLLERQKSIQKKLAQKHLKQSHLILYDITSSYFEGEYRNSDIVAFGYNRDEKRSHEQIVIGLVCSPEGCPIGIEVYPGNTKDSETVVEKVNEIKTDYDIDKIIFVGDRGMLTSCNRAELSSVKDLQTITALTHPEMLDLLNRKVIQLNFFDETNIREVVDPEDPKRRYMLCRNPNSALKECKTREKLLELTKEGLQHIAAYKRATSVEKLGGRIGVLINKYKMGKFVTWKITKDPLNAVSSLHKVEWQFDQEKIQREKNLDGCYVITTDVEADSLNTQEVVATYKKLTLVEKAFRNLKTAQLEVRPTYHKKDDRIRAHVFLCMLAYYVQWHMQKALKPLFEEDGKGANREWTMHTVIETLCALTRNLVKVNGISFHQVSRPNDDQKRILQLLGVSM